MRHKTILKSIFIIFSISWALPALSAEKWIKGRLEKVGKDYLTIDGKRYDITKDFTIDKYSEEASPVILSSEVSKGYEDSTKTNENEIVVNLKSLMAVEKIMFQLKDGKISNIKVLERRD